MYLGTYRLRSAEGAVPAGYWVGLEHRPTGLADDIAVLLAIVFRVRCRCGCECAGAGSGARQMLRQRATAHNLKKGCRPSLVGSAFRLEYI